MRIGFIVSQFPLISETFIVNQAVGLIERGHQVHIYALHGRPPSTTKVHPLVEQYRLEDRTFYGPPTAGQKTHDILHGQFGPLGIEGIKYRTSHRIPERLVTSFRGYDISWYVQEHGAEVYKELFQAGDRFLTNCEYFRHRLLKLGCPNDKLSVHRSGLDGRSYVFGNYPE